MSHARGTYPEECCGLLIGCNSNPRHVQLTFAARNAAQPPRFRRYRIDPIEFIHASNEARRTNLELIGVYHSHPDAPVEPSQVDLENAWPNFTYIVISLEKGALRDVGAWSLNDLAATFELEELTVI